MNKKQYAQIEFEATKKRNAAIAAAKAAYQKAVDEAIAEYEKTTADALAQTKE